jgi:DNA-binding NarL/FixJ family response regulator
MEAAWNSGSKRVQNKLTARPVGVETLVENSIPALVELPGLNPPEQILSKTEPHYWRQRLLLRRYHFPASGAAGQALAAHIEHDGQGYFFPLGSTDSEAAALKAAKIYQAVISEGWPVVCERFARELIVSFEWCMNPVLWTYTTIHTLVDGAIRPETGTPMNPNRQRVLVVELDAGIRRAMCWSIDQQSGFSSVACDSVEAFNRALAIHKPRMVLLNHNMAGRLGYKSTGAIAPIQPGVPALVYSVHADGDHMFVSTPGGCNGYLVKRVKPDRLLEPILSITTRSELMTEDLLLRVKYYFQELLQLPSGPDNSALAKLTRREREVLELLSKGCVDKEIAQTMGISVWTVHGYIKSIFERLHVHTRTEAVVRYLEK